uniref:Uncharacterized protein n=1 Tax=Ixodes ricinus TaxID=34613 RepID=A0A6B0UEA6_IXORI
MNCSRNASCCVLIIQKVSAASSSIVDSGPALLSGFLELKQNRSIQAVMRRALWRQLNLPKSNKSGFMLWAVVEYLSLSFIYVAFLIFFRYFLRPSRHS